MAPRRKVTPAMERLERLRKARVGAPTLRASAPNATHVGVELRFDADTYLEPAPQVFTIFPTAQAHFVYACPFGDCDGTYDLNDTVFGLLREEACQMADVLRCTGHRSHGGGAGTACGLGMAYAVIVHYEEAALSR
ncbi:MAG: hypothetical protein ABI645_05610 [Pseudomonadota bacterium]